MSVGGIDELPLQFNRNHGIQLLSGQCERVVVADGLVGVDRAGDIEVLACIRVFVFHKINGRMSEVQNKRKLHFDTSGVVRWLEMNV